MKSPFPGMDPFLEHPSFFPDLHGRFNVYLGKLCNLNYPTRISRC